MPRKIKQGIRDLFGNKNDEVKTPASIYDVLERLFGEFFDPCPLVRPDWDGLKIEWGTNNYVNPPFSQIKKWILKAIAEAEKGKQSVFLVTARISSKYWFDHVWPNAKGIWLLEGATQFEGHKGKLPIPLSVILFGPCRPAGMESWLTPGKISKFNEEKRWIRVL